MLDVETKSRINTARDILVGKVPDPKSQVEQITIALIYKFMDDMDVESEELGGKRTFFVGEYAKYAWRKIFDPRQSGYELLNLYSEAIGKMDTNPGVPKLFRDIFKNAYLPYRDPETLKSFLKIINEFDYSHSEKLGDAFEYLLSVLGSQGDAGQFRTPRHIIDFMVEIVDPKKDETILDPACGTAGFLISSYKHIIRQNSSNYNPDEQNGVSSSGDQSVADRIISTNGYAGDKLTADDRKLLAKNIHGYDISPDMVRLSLVNMYLHGIKDPKIFEYDTLTSEDNWHHFSDVILANPPFMSPKGGIRPHKRFSVQSNRSEVLFVDYIAEHLTSTGRAAVIVPEGIIFQSGKAYKQLRKMLVDDCLVGVISLPAGVFNPYSGVKTSILWLDKALAKKTDKVLFVRIENDGFDLGAQRRSIKQNDIPDVLKITTAFIKVLQNAESNDLGDDSRFILIGKELIGDTDEFNLSAERYRIKKSIQTTYPMVTLSQVISGKPEYGSGAKKVDFDGSVRYLRITDILDNGTLKDEDIVSPSVIEPDYFLKEDDFLIARSGSVGRAYLHKNVALKCQFAGYLIRFNLKKDIVLPAFMFYLTKSGDYSGWIESMKKSGTISNINAQEYGTFAFPLPPLPAQKEIVTEIESYQKIIDGARQVVENYKPRIDIDPEWEMVELGEIAEITSSKRIFQEEYVAEGVPFYRTKEVVELSKGHPISLELFIPQSRYDEIRKKYEVPNKGDILLSAVGTIGVSWVVEDNREFYFKDGNLLWIKNIRNAIPEFIKTVLDHRLISELDKMIYGAAYKALTIVKLKELKIPLPSVEVQKQIVADITQEQSLIVASKQLITIYEGKIKNRMAKVWGE